MEISALITIYNPDNKVGDNIRQIASQVSRVFVIDNSKNSCAFVFPENVIYIFNNKNCGLSIGFNKVLKNYEFKNDEFVIFFDQDSIITDDYIDKLTKQFIDNEKSMNLGVAGPLIYDRNAEAVSMGNLSNRDNYVAFVPRIITSSMITRFSVLEEIGFWDDAIFLDWADFDLTYRIIKQGYKAGIFTNVILNHQLGENYVHFLGHAFTYYSPIREYYQIRDALRLSVKKSTPFKERLGFFKVVFLRPFFHLLLLDKKMERLDFYKKAHKDFKKNKVGEYGQ